MTDRLQRHLDMVILALDQMSLYFQAALTRVWSPIGQTPRIRISPQRECVHFYRALELRSGRDIAVTAPEQTMALTTDFLRLLLLLVPTQPILLLLDRAPWRGVDGLLAENEWLELQYFPPAFPDFNRRSMFGNAPAMPSAQSYLLSV